MITCARTVFCSTSNAETRKSARRAQPQPGECSAAHPPVARPPNQPTKKPTNKHVNKRTNQPANKHDGSQYPHGGGNNTLVKFYNTESLNQNVKNIWKAPLNSKKGPRWQEARK